jgi:hypothetical protein
MPRDRGGPAAAPPTTKAPSPRREEGAATLGPARYPPMLTEAVMFQRSRSSQLLGSTTTV